MFCLFLFFIRFLRCYVVVCSPPCLLVVSSLSSGMSLVCRLSSVLFCHLRVCAECMHACACDADHGAVTDCLATYPGTVIGVGFNEIRRWASARSWGLRGLRDWGWYSTRTGVTLSCTTNDYYYINTMNIHIMRTSWVRIFVSVVNLCAVVEVSRSIKRKQPYPTIFSFVCLFFSIWGSVAAFGWLALQAPRKQNISGDSNFHSLTNSNVAVACLDWRRTIYYY